MAITKQLALAAGLRLRGWIPRPDLDKSKHIVFQDPKYGNFAFIGKQGALRVGANISSSRSVTGGQAYNTLLITGGYKA